jgi:hypothetical protein
MSSEVLVTVAHLRKARMCSRGARMWAQRYGIDYVRFLHEGVPASTLEATGDALGKKLAAVARAEAAGEDEE